METQAKLSPTGKRASLSLSAQERSDLEKQTKASVREEADRAQIILRLAEGATSKQVAQEVGIHPVAVRRIKRRFLAHRTGGLATRKQTGRPPTKRVAILDWVTRHAQCGRLQEPSAGILSAREIADRLLADCQIRVSIAAVRLALKKGGTATGESAIA
jgi:transposase